MERRFLIIGSISIAIVLGIVGFSLAAGTADIQFPIAELGGCADQAACKAYCDDAAHSDDCVAFAKAHGLINEADAAKIEAVQNHQGPGGCTDDKSCRAYCADEAHQDECTQFAIDHGFMTREEAARARKPGPGGCRGDQCRAYCADPAHQEECMQFAVDNGFISREDASRIKQAKQKIKEAGGGPGGCASEEACRAYCEDPAHLDLCIAFGEEHGLIDREEVQEIRKAGLASGPGGCRGADACRTFCDNPAHQQVCLDWAREHGVISKGQAIQAEKILNKPGPGGCQGSQCREYCAETSHAEECLAFAEKNDLISSQEAARAKKFIAASQQGGPGGCRGDQCRAYCDDPAHQDECLAFVKERGLITKDEEKQFEAGRKIRQTVQESGGPGGCKDDHTCREYCSDPAHVEECIAFASAHGGVPEDQARQMLRDFTEQRAHASGEFQQLEDLSDTQQQSQQKFEEFRQLEQQFRRPEFGDRFSREQQEQKGTEHPEEGGAGAPNMMRMGPGMPPPPGQSSGGMPPTGGMIGPGGCRSASECIKYCSEHTDACFRGGAAGQGSSGHSGSMPPGGRGAPPSMPQLRKDFMEQMRMQNQMQDGMMQGSFQHAPSEGSMPPGDAGGISPPDGSWRQSQPGSGNFTPPSGAPNGMPPPSGWSGQSDGSVMPPPGGTESMPPPSGTGSFMPPPGSGSIPPPPPPSGLAPFLHLFGAIVQGVLGLTR